MCCTQNVYVLETVLALGATDCMLRRGSDVRFMMISGKIQDKFSILYSSSQTAGHTPLMGHGAQPKERRDSAQRLYVFFNVAGRTNDTSRYSPNLF